MPVSTAIPEIEREIIEILTRRPQSGRDVARTLADRYDENETRSALLDAAYRGAIRIIDGTLRVSAPEPS